MILSKNETKIMEFYTVARIRALLGGCQRAYVHKLAKQKGWQFETYQTAAGPFAKRYAAADVDKEIERRRVKSEGLQEI